MKNKLLFLTFLLLGMYTKADDKAILEALYEATDGANWTNTWDLNADMSTWYGVTVNASNRVTGLNLSNNKLTGTLPESIWGLTELESLDFNFNFNLTGTISSDIGNLTKLKLLRLTNNGLSGTFPPEVFTITALGALEVSGQFEGSLTGIENLVNLKKISLNGSKFSTIPDSFWTLTGLEDVLITNLSTPNTLTYKIPAVIEQFTSLKKLYISGINTENIPNEITNLTTLKELTLTGTLIGPFPQNISNMSALERLALEGNNLNTNNGLTGAIPEGVSNLSNLKVLNLTRNKLSGVIPTNIGSLTNLEFLSFSNNLLDTEIPSSIESLTKLKTLWLLDCGLKGNLPVNIGNLTNLESIRVDNNNLEGVIPASFTNLTKLKTAILGKNNLSGALPANFGNLIAMSRLYLNDNNFSGIIPASFVNMTNLREAYFYNNKFEGIIPNLTSLSNLNKLSVRGNEYVFEDLEPNFVHYSTNLSNFQYSPQARIDNEETISLVQGQQIELSVDETQSVNNSYQWKKDGVDIAGATERIYTISSASNSDIGVYTCYVTNSVVTGLTLIRNNITLDVTLNDVETANVEFKVYPNPTSGKILFASESELGKKVTVMVYGVQGNLMFQQNNILNNTIDVSELSTGIYILKLNAGNKTYTSRIVKL